MAGLVDSDLMRNFRTVKCPYTRETLVAIPAIAPDWAILHAQEADENGNVRIHGPKYDDLLKAKAARNVLVTCERLIPVSETARQPERTDLPGFLVTAVVESPSGAYPHGCAGEYAHAEEFFREYLGAAAGTDEQYRAFVAERVVGR